MKDSFSDGIYTVIYLLILNIIISVIYLITGIIKKDYKRGFMMTVFMLLAPIVGPLYIAISWIIYRVYFKSRKGILSIEELSIRKDKIEVIVRDDIQSALNKVPMEEALIISDSRDTRRLLLDVLKEDRGQYINSIYRATDNEDSEVSHYAASAITDIMDKFKEKEKILSTKYNEDKNDEGIAETYWRYLSEFLMTKVLSSVEQDRYLKRLQDLTINLEADMPSVVTGELYYRIVVILIDLEKTEQAELWVNKALKNRKGDLDSYKAGLKFYYTTNETVKFRKLVEELMNSNVRLDRETLEFIRFYKL